MNPAPKVSVIVPAYNTATWLPECLDSLLSQTYQNLEIIVIDDGSTDYTSHIAQKYSTYDSRVRVYQQPNSGVSMARLNGVSRAAGDYIGFVDSDDIIHSHMYARLVNIAVSTGSDVICCEMSNFDEHVDFSSPDNAGIHHINGEDAIRHLLFTGKIDSTMCAKLYKRSLISNECFCSGITNNEDLLSNFIIIQKSSKVALSNYVGYYYRKRLGSASRGAMSEISVTQMKINVRERIFDAASKENLNMAARLYVLFVFSLVHKYFHKDGHIAHEISKICMESMQIRGKIFAHASFKYRLMRCICLKSPNLYSAILRCYKQFFLMLHHN